MPPRVRPVEEITDELRETYTRAGLRPDRKPYNIFSTVGNHPDLLRRWLSLLLHTLSKSTLAPRDRELLILRVGALCASPYEFSHHAVAALECGLTAEEIERVKDGPTHHGWSNADRELLVAVDELHADSCISDATWEALAERYSVEQMLDIVATVGNYHLVAYMVNSCRVELDDGVPDALSPHDP